MQLNVILKKYIQKKRIINERTRPAIPFPYHGIFTKTCLIGVQVTSYGGVKCRANSIQRQQAILEIKFEIEIWIRYVARPIMFRVIEYEIFGEGCENFVLNCLPKVYLMLCILEQRTK